MDFERGKRRGIHFLGGWTLKGTLPSQKKGKRKKGPTRQLGRKEGAAGGQGAKLADQAPSAGPPVEVKPKGYRPNKSGLNMFAYHDPTLLSLHVSGVLRSIARDLLSNCKPATGTSAEQQTPNAHQAATYQEFWQLPVTLKNTEKTTASKKGVFASWCFTILPIA